MPFQVTLEKFSGPLQLLLDLIEREELPINEVALAKVTDDYLEHIRMTDVPTEELADFLVVATKLLLIKSRSILPDLTIEEEDDPSKLSAQLKMYQEFVKASAFLDEGFRSARVAFARTKTSLPPAPKFSPPKAFVLADLPQVFSSILKKLEPFFALKEASMRRVVSVQEKIRQLQDVIRERAQLTFSDMLGKDKRRVDVVVSFLALLELVKLHVVHVAQHTHFGDITIKHVD